MVMIIWDIISIRMKIFTELNTCDSLTLRYFPHFTWVNKMKKTLQMQVVCLIALNTRGADTRKEAVKLNPLNAELNPICHLLALLGAHHIFHVSGIRVNRICISYCVNVKGQDASVHTM